MYAYKRIQSYYKGERVISFISYKASFLWGDNMLIVFGTSLQISYDVRQ